MLTTRENYLIAARRGKPEYVPAFPRDANVFMPDFWNEVDLETGTDFFNVKWIDNKAGKMPDERWQAMEEISQWRETVKFPDLTKMDWEAMKSRYLENFDPDKVNIAMLNTYSLFLIPINMLGWVEGLCSIHSDREELRVFISAITDFLVELTHKICELINPDIIFTGDDFAAATGPFVSKEVWQDLYKPYFEKIISAIKEHGCLAEFHCCGNCQYLITEFMDIGVDICQLPIPNIELKKDKERFNSRLVLTGGWERHGDAGMPGASESVVIESVRYAIDTFGKDGALIFWDAGIIEDNEDSIQKMKWVYHELEKCGSVVYANG